MYRRGGWCHWVYRLSAMEMLEECISAVLQKHVCVISIKPKPKKKMKNVDQNTHTATCTYINITVFFLNPTFDLQLAHRKH